MVPPRQFSSWPQHSAGRLFEALGVETLLEVRPIERPVLDEHLIKGSSFPNPALALEEVGVEMV